MSDSFIQRGGLWVIGQSILMFAVIALGVAYPGDWTQWAMVVPGATLFTLGGVVGVAGVWVLGGNRTPFPAPRPQSQLVQRGIYSLIRHPLYTSVMLSSLGWALLWQCWAAVAAALVLIPFFDAKARHEERRLRNTFPEYTEYQRRVRRFIPWIY